MRGVLNFPPKQVGPFMSEFLLMGFDVCQDGAARQRANDKIAPSAHYHQRPPLMSKLVFMTGFSFLWQKTRRT